MGATSTWRWPPSAAIFQPYTYIENGAGFQGRLVNYARTLVRGAAERDKPNGQRFREFTDSALPRVQQNLGASVPVYPELEELRLGNSLERMREWLGPDHPVVRKLMSKESPAALAKRLVTETKLADPAVRLELWKGGSAAIAASNDPMIVLARSIDADARAVRKTFEDSVEAPLRSATERIARARFATLGTSVYPDATFTLRLNYGTVQGWNENGKPVEPFTRLSRAFERATGSDPFRIPESWERVKGKLDMNTPFNLSHQQRHRRRQFRQPVDQRQGRNRRPAVRRQHPLDLRRVLVRHREEPRHRRASRHHAGGAVEGLRG